jgi:UPF0755 protein
VTIIKKLLIGFGLALCVAIVLAFLWYEQSINTDFDVPNHQDFVVTKGDTAFRILANIPHFKGKYHLYAARLWLKLNKEKTNIKLGHFELNEEENLISLFQKLVDGKQKQFYVSLIEGQTFDQWLKILKNTAHLSADITEEHALYDLLINQHDFCKNEYKKLEGCLLANTYSYTSNETLSGLITRTYIQMKDMLDELWVSRYQDIAIDTPYHALILASIIEKETAVASEREVISGVFNNRLHKNMRLQTDPTVIYGVRDEYQGDITRKHLRTPTPYNTYVIKGLPITPIAMVGQASLEAATKPSLTDYLYFVAKGDGTHQFSETLQAHNQAVRQYQLNKGN